MNSLRQKYNSHETKRLSAFFTVALSTRPVAAKQQCTRHEYFRTWCAPDARSQEFNTSPRMSQSVDSVIHRSRGLWRKRNACQSFSGKVIHRRWYSWREAWQVCTAWRITKFRSGSSSRGRISSWRECLFHDFCFPFSPPFFFFLLSSRSIIPVAVHLSRDTVCPRKA